MAENAENIVCQYCLQNVCQNSAEDVGRNTTDTNVGLPLLVSAKDWQYQTSIFLAFASSIRRRAQCCTGVSTVHFIGEDLLGWGLKTRRRSWSRLRLVFRHFVREQWGPLSWRGSSVWQRTISAPACKFIFETSSLLVTVTWSRCSKAHSRNGIVSGDEEDPSREAVDVHRQGQGDPVDCLQYI